MVTLRFRGVEKGTSWLELAKDMRRLRDMWKPRIINIFRVISKIHGPNRTITSANTT